MTTDEELEQDISSFPRRLETARLILRLPRLKDAPHIAALADNFAVAEMTASLPNPFSLEEATAFLIRATEKFDQGPVFIVQLHAGGEIAGVCGFSPCKDEAGSEIGYWLGQPYWGRGYATEAAHTVIDLFFTATPARRLFASCRVINRDSRRVLEKCGFQRVGDGMIASRALGGLVPVDRYCLERRVWRSLKGWAAA